MMKAVSTARMVTGSVELARQYLVASALSLYSADLASMDIDDGGEGRLQDAHGLSVLMPCA